MKLQLDFGHFLARNLTRQCLPYLFRCDLLLQPSNICRHCLVRFGARKWPKSSCGRIASVEYSPKSNYKIGNLNIWRNWLKSGEIAGRRSICQVVKEPVCKTLADFPPKTRCSVGFGPIVRNLPKNQGESGNGRTEKTLSILASQESKFWANHLTFAVDITIIHVRGDWH